MRVFIAVELSGEQKNKLYELQQAIKNAGMEANVVAKENIHITLKFLGEIGENDLEIVKNSLKEALEGVKSFQVSIKGVGAFPSMARPRVIWAGIEDGRDELIELAGRIDEKVVVREFDKTPFSPHITVARLKSERHVAALEGIKRNFEEFEFGKTFVSEVKIRESRLSSGGPSYSDLYKAALQ